MGFHRGDAETQSIFCLDYYRVFLCALRVSAVSN